MLRFQVFCFWCHRERTRVWTYVTTLEKIRVQMLWKPSKKTHSWNRINHHGLIVQFEVSEFEHISRSLFRKFLLCYIVRLEYFFHQYLKMTFCRSCQSVALFYVNAVFGDCVKFLTTPCSVSQFQLFSLCSMH